MRIISPYYESSVTLGNGQTSLNGGSNALSNALKGLSQGSALLPMYVNLYINDILMTHLFPLIK